MFQLRAELKAIHPRNLQIVDTICQIQHYKWWEKCIHNISCKISWSITYLVIPFQVSLFFHVKLLLSKYQLFFPQFCYIKDITNICKKQFHKLYKVCTKWYDCNNSHIQVIWNFYIAIKKVEKISYALHTELFSTFLLNNVYRTHFESFLPCRVFVAYPPQRHSPILFPPKKLTR